jgi:antitoxin (DNA-binding transcriptional repressor) of toxin-antitoxin stability system
MESVGIRQFKENMGHYVDLLRSGQDIILTDRKKQIAKITPVGMSATEEAVRQMVLDGKASWSGGRPQSHRDRVQIKGKGVADAVVEDRR